MPPERVSMAVVRFLFLACVAATAMGVAQTVAAARASVPVSARVEAVVEGSVLLVLEGPAPGRVSLRADDAASAWAECEAAGDAWRCPSPAGADQARLLVTAWTR
ncbi:MAG: hypothetical protein AMXMBFR23_04010 [Chloroflexota bacterium]